MYKPSFYALILALTVSIITLALFAISAREEMLRGINHLIYYANDVITEISFRLYVIIFLVLIIDLNERRKIK